MSTRALVIGLFVSGVLASSCASTARDTLVDIYNDEAAASSYLEACQVNAQTFATATDAYLALNGAMPESTADLVPEYLLHVPADWQFDPSSESSFTPVPGGPCDDIHAASQSSPSIGQAAIEAIDDGNDAGCVTDRQQVELAVEAHFALNGYDATTMDDLLQFGVEDEGNRWTLQIPADATSTAPTVAPTVGGPCDV